VTIAVSAARDLPLLGAILLIGGASWISFISLLNVQVLNQAPDWVRARVLAVAMLVFQGAVAGGSATWGALANRFGINHALLWAGIGALAAASLGFFVRLPDLSLDLTPWNHWRLPDHIPAEIDTEGPILVTVEYQVKADHAAEFLEAMREYGRIRRRDGASRWGVCRDLEREDRYLETFVVSSWAEHLRQHERMTRADLHLEERIGQFTLQEPHVHHMIYL